MDDSYWNSHLPLSAASKHPLRISDPDQIGPLRFTPKPESLSTLFSLHIPPSVLFAPLQQLTLPRFLSSTSSSSAVPSTTGILSSLEGNGASRAEGPYSRFAHNRIQLIRCGYTEDGDSEFVVLFPVGENDDQVGYLGLRVDRDGEIFVVADDNDEAFSYGKSFSHHIVRMIVSEVRGRLDLFGYIVVCTTYEAHWFCFKRKKVTDGLISLNYLGVSRLDGEIAGCCWSSKLPEYCMVLLDNGRLYLFDMMLLEDTNDHGLEVVDNIIKGTRLKVSWEQFGRLGSQKWLGCEFGWHPQTVIVARSDAVFLVDFTNKNCIISCMANIKTLGACASAKTDRFTAFSKAGPDSPHFVVASNKLLMLYNMSDPRVPLLQWSHGLDRPCYIHVFRLSQLRSNSGNNACSWASNSGFCILLGSFWTSEFGLFCYGPSPHATVGGNIFDPLFEWDQPSELCLSGHECRSGSSLLNEDLSRNSLPEWIEWQRKTDFVLGFSLLGSDFLPICTDGEYGGFTVIRLMSSGKLECQRYLASWNHARNVTAGAAFPFKDDILHTEVEEKYKFPRRFKYIKIDHLSGFLSGNLASTLKSKVVDPVKEDDFEGSEVVDSVKEHLEGSFSPTLEEKFCKKLQASGLLLGSPLEIASVFDDIVLPSTIGEIISRKSWVELPVEYLMLAFSNYSEILKVLFNQKEVSLEFLVVPEQPQLPPFILREPSCCSSKRPNRVQPGDALVGPISPVPFLCTLNNINTGSVNGKKITCGLSCEAELDQDYDAVMQVATEIAMSESSHAVDGEMAVSLADDRENWTGSQPKPYLSYGIGAFKPHVHPICSNMVAKVCSQEKVSGGGVDFDDLCPIKLKFNDVHVDFGTEEQAALKILKRQFLKRQEGFGPYQNFLSSCNLKKPKATT